MSNAMLVISSFWNVPDPLGRFIATLFLNPEVSDAKSRSCESGNLEIKGNRGFIPNFALGWRDQLNVSSKQAFSIALEPFEAPHDALTVWLIYCAASATWKDSHLSRVRRNWNLTDNVCAVVALLKEGFYANRKLNLVLLRVLLNNRHDFKWQVDVLTDAVCHNIENSVRWDKSDRSISIKLAESHALVELDVVDLNAFVSRLTSNCWGIICSSAHLHQEFVIDTELAFWHASEECFNAYSAENVRL